MNADNDARAVWVGRLFYQGMNRPRRLLAILCALLLLALQAPLSGARAAVDLPGSPSRALLQSVHSSDHHAILKDGQAAPERGVPHDADVPAIVQTPLAVAPFRLLQTRLSDQVALRRLELGFWACAPPVARS